MASKGDKYIIEIDEVIEAEKRNLYKVKGFRALVFDDLGLEKLKKYKTCAETPGIIQGFKGLVKMMRSGERILPGQKVDCIGPKGEKTEFVVAETRAQKCGAGCVIVAQRTVTHYMPFCTPDKAHPFGWNNYEKSDARKYLLTEFSRRLTRDDMACVIPRSIPQANGELDYIWLLDTCEVEGENAFEWYCTDANRVLRDTDGDKCTWFLRDPYPFSLEYVRAVSSLGSRGNRSASIS